MGVPGDAQGWDIAIPFLPAGRGDVQIASSV
jgi:hypothetical protein